MDFLLQDIRYAARRLARSAGFTAVTALTLGAGIGATTAIFSAVDAVLLRSLPFEDPARLVSVGVEGGGSSYMDMLDWRAGIEAFEQVGLYSSANWPYDLTGGDRPERIQGAVVSPSFFDVLGAQAARGRTFAADEERAGGPRVAVVSHGFWQRRLGGDPRVVGRNVALNGYAYQVIGVMPTAFSFPDPEVAFWAPIPAELPIATTEDGRGVHAFYGLARLRPGATLAETQSRIDALARRLEERYPEDNAGMRWTLQPLQKALVADRRPALLILLGAVALVLLITCANVASLLVVRAAGRQKEVAVRRALGAGRLRLARQFLTESLLLAALGGTVGALLALWMSDVLAGMAPAGLLPHGGLELDARVLGFALASTLATGLAFGLAPAVLGTRSEVDRALREGSRGVVGGGRRARLRGGLVVGEVALALVLLVGAGLLIRSLLNLQRVDPGFDPAGVLTFRIALPESRYADVPAQAAFFQQALERIRSLPGVRMAGGVGDLPLTDDFYAPHDMEIEGRPVPVGEEPDIAHRPATPGYLEALRIPVLRGRGITASDREGAPLAAWINEAMARRFWPGEDPLGKRIRWSSDEGEPRWLTIVGVVGDVKSFGLAEEEEPAIYSAHPQSLFPWRRQMTLVVRATGDPRRLVPLIEREVWAVDPDIPVTAFRTMTELMGDSVVRTRFQSLLLGAFAAIALILAALGIYGVIAQSVALRTQEIGVRMALGARSGEVARGVLAEGAKLALAGIVVGLAGALAATRALSDMLYGVSPTDLQTIGAITAVLLATALLASWLPARRATRVDPLVALRYE